MVFSVILYLHIVQYTTRISIREAAYYAAYKVVSPAINDNLRETRHTTAELKWPL